MGARVFLDESGDHGLRNFDPAYPVFVLAAVLLDDSGLRRLEADFLALKVAYFGSGEVIFHEREIRRREGPYAHLDRKRYLAFVDELSEVIRRTPFSVIAAVIDKRRLVRSYRAPRNPYEIALGFVMERVAMEVGAIPEGALPLCLEGRGRKEDRELLRVFRALREGRDPLAAELKYGARATLAKMRLLFCSKDPSLAGLQLADLVARPIGLSTLRPGQRNRAFEVIRTKLRRGPGGEVRGYGLKVFP